MIKVRVGNAENRQTVLVSGDTTIAQVLEDAGQDYTRYKPYLSNTPLTQAQCQMTFNQLGAEDNCTLTCVQKPDNAR